MFFGIYFASDITPRLDAGALLPVSGGDLAVYISHTYCTNKPMASRPVGLEGGDGRVRGGNVRMRDFLLIVNRTSGIRYITHADLTGAFQ